MKKIIFAALAASSALIATSASAQVVSGDVTITGSVAPKCLVVTGGVPASANFAGTIALGELSQANGTLRTDVESTFDTAANGLAFQVVCTSGRPTVTVDANAIAAQNVATAPAGYARLVHYTANVTFDETPSGSELVSNDSLTNAAATSLQLANRLASGATNIHIDGANFRTPTAGNTDILVADVSYEGHILITISPTA